MSIISKTSLSIKCDGCGDMIYDKDNGYYFDTIDEINLMIKINGWEKKNTLHYCERCAKYLKDKNLLSNNDIVIL